MSYITAIRYIPIEVDCVPFVIPSYSTITFGSDNYSSMMYGSKYLILVNTNHKTDAEYSSRMNFDTMCEL